MTTSQSNLATELRDHGVAVRNGWCRAFKPWRDPKTGRDYIYCGIFTTPALIVRLDVTTGKCRTWRMPPECMWPWGVEVTDEGHVLASSSTGKLCRLDPKTGRIWVTADIGMWTWGIKRHTDGKYYFTTQDGRLFWYDAATEKHEAFSGPEKLRPNIPALVGDQILADGRVVRYLDPEIICIGKGKNEQRFQLKYKTDGTGIFHLAAGPNETVYASTIMPLYLIRYTPATGKLENLGRGAPDNGEVYSFGHCAGKLYYGCYSEGNLVCYDPANPIRRGKPGALTWKYNPRLITRLGEGHMRPRAMCIDSQKRVWVGSLPTKGTRHGGLGCYNIVTRKYVNHPMVIRNQSVWALAADTAGKVIYGGTTINSGIKPETKEAHLFAWDANRQKLLWKQVAIPGVTDYSNLLFHAGKLYGTTGNKPFSFFCFDPKKRAMEYVVPSEISGAREQSICLGPDGNIYGITWMVLFRWHPATGKIEELHRCLGEDAKPFGGALFHRGAVIIKGRYYFSCGTKVMSLRLPQETSNNGAIKL